MAKDQHIEVTGVDVSKTALTHGFAVGPIAVHRLVTSCLEPIEDSSSFRIQISNR
jgi:hypothetical protein